MTVRYQIPKDHSHFSEVLEHVEAYGMQIVDLKMEPDRYLLTVDKPFPEIEYRPLRLLEV